MRERTTGGSATMGHDGARTRPHLQLGLEVLLPDIPDERDRCVDRLVGTLSDRPGITEVHLTEDGDGGETICLHYDPKAISLARIESLARAAGSTLTDRYGHTVIALGEIQSEDGGQRVERELRRLDGVVAASVNTAAEQVYVEFERDRISVDELRASLRGMGYGRSRVAGERRTDEHAGHDHAAVPDDAGWYARNQELAWSLIAGVLLLVAWVGERWVGVPKVAAIGLYLAAYGFGAYDLVRHAIGPIRRGRLEFDIDLLMLLAATGAAILGQWAEGAFLLFLFSLAHALEHVALDRARHAIEALAELAPPQARVIRGDDIVTVPVEDVAVGDVVVVRPGDRLPTDGQVRAGRSTVNQAPITGESIPIEKESGSEAFAGTINGEGTLEIETTRAAGDRTLDRVVQLVAEAQEQKAPTQRFTDRFARIFVPVVLIADLLLIVVPPALGLLTLGDSFYRAMALLVAASPCALALGTPSAVLAGIAQAGRKGVLIKGGEYLENLGTLRAMALDKTGTVTVGKPEVIDVVPLPTATEDELITVAAAVERQSQHPLAEAVVRHADTGERQLPEAGELRSVTGRGIVSSLDGETVRVGNLRLWEHEGVTVPTEVRDTVTRLQESGRSIMAVQHGERWLGVLGIADQPREGVEDVLGRLRQLGIKPIVMLTGDSRGVGEAIGQRVGVDEVRAELLPEDKVGALNALLDRHGKVAMVGDGVNDAPALAQATVGIAMGGAGTGVALETADVALMGDDLGRLPFAVSLSRQAATIIRQNLYVSLGVIAWLIVASTTGLFSIGWAVLFHEGSTLVVIANALRLLAFRGD